MQLSCGSTPLVWCSVRSCNERSRALAWNVGVINSFDGYSNWHEKEIDLCAPFPAFQIIYAAQALSNYPTSKIAKENFDVFGDAWSQQINDLSILVKDINDICQGKQGTKQVYLSLPRPGVSFRQRWLCFFALFVITVIFPNNLFWMTCCKFCVSKCND